MSNIFKIMLYMITIIVVIGCSKSTTEPSEIDIPDLYKTWLHSYEEQETYYPELFRPDDYKEFLASRFRMKYTFNKNGSCQWMVLSPDDAHYLQSGTFRRYDMKVFIFDNNGTLQDHLSFKIINLQQNLLETTRID